MNADNTPKDGLVNSARFRAGDGEYGYAFTHMHDDETIYGNRADSADEALAEVAEFSHWVVVNPEGAVIATSWDKYE